jgi:DNA-binding MarR family transcriptional regulator
MEPGSTAGACQPPRAIARPIFEARLLCSYWLKRADRRFATSLARELRDRGIIASEWAALREMYRPNRSSPVALATAIGMTKGGASKLLDRLVRKGLARKEVSEFDRRYRPATLTERGQKLVTYLAIHDVSIERELLPKDSQRSSLIRALKHIVFAPSKEPVDPWHPAQHRRSPATSPFYSPDMAPPPSAVASNASNSSDDSSRNRPRDK